MIRGQGKVREREPPTANPCTIKGVETQQRIIDEEITVIPPAEALTRTAGGCQPYIEGSIFLVPLRTRGYAIGVAARVSPRGRAVLRYFFGPRVVSTETPALNNLDPTAAILRIIFGDLGLISGKWSVIGTVPNWDRRMWPIPDFVRLDPLGRRKPVLVRYADDDLNRVEYESEIESAVGFLPDVAAGYGAVELRLTKLLVPQ